MAFDNTASACAILRKVSRVVFCSRATIRMLRIRPGVGPEALTDFTPFGVWASPKSLPRKFERTGVCVVRLEKWDGAFFITRLIPSSNQEF